MKLFGSFTRGKNGIAVRSPDLTRRGLIVSAAASLIAAPAIVRAASLMPVRSLPNNIFGFEFDVNQLLTISTERYSFGWCDWRVFGQAANELLPNLEEWRHRYQMMPTVG